MLMSWMFWLNENCLHWFDIVPQSNCNFRCLPHNGLCVFLFYLFQGNDYFFIIILKQNFEKKKTRTKAKQWLFFFIKKKYLVRRLFEFGIVFFVAVLPQSSRLLCVLYAWPSVCCWLATTRSMLSLRLMSWPRVCTTPTRCWQFDCDTRSTTRTWDCWEQSIEQRDFRIVKKWKKEKKKERKKISKLTNIWFLNLNTLLFFNFGYRYII